MNDEFPKRVPRTELTNAQYHAHAGINASALEAIARSPLHYWDERLKPGRIIKEPSDAMKFGSAFHAKIESEEVFKSLYREGPDARRNTNQWKDAEARALPKTLLKPDEFAALDAMSVIFNNQKWLAEKVFSRDDVSFEETFFWMRDGELCKLRVDIFVPGFAIIDTKVTHDARPEAFEKTIDSFSYHRRAAWYQDGIFACTGETLPYVFACIEPEAPHGCWIHSARPEMLSIGRVENNALFDLLVKCTKSNDWPGYPEEVTDIGPTSRQLWKQKNGDLK